MGRCRTRRFHGTAIRPGRWEERTATLNPARYFQMEKQFGTVEEGRFADLVLLDANPLENISNTQKIAAVVLNGKYLSRGELQKLLAKVEESAKKEPVAPRAASSFWADRSANSHK